jgi:hypothetical protein
MARPMKMLPKMMDNGQTLSRHESGSQIVHGLYYGLFDTSIK